MKKELLSIALFAACIPAIAQIPGSATVMLQAPVTAIHSNNLNKTSAVAGSRVIAFVNYNSNGATFVITDSGACYYSGTRGGDFDHTLKYDNAISYSYSSSAYTNNRNYLQTFDANNNILTYVSQGWQVSASTWVNGNQDTYTYDGNNNMLTQITQNWNAGSSTWINLSKYTRTYDANNNVLTQVGQSWNVTTNTWTNSYQYIFTYTSANKVATQITQNWNATTSAWDNSSKLANTYDAVNNLTTVLSTLWNSTTNTWDNDIKHSYTYDASNNQLTDLDQGWNSTTSMWENSQLITNSSFAGSAPQIRIVQNWDATTSAFVNSNKYTYTYNSFGQITYDYSETWNVGGFFQPTTSDRASRYYYETYTTDVKNVSNTGGSATIYPVPASNMLHIELKWDEAQAFSVILYNVTGDVVMQWNEASAAQYNTSFSLSNLPAGNYFIKIQGDKGQVVKKLIIAH